MSDDSAETILARALIIALKTAEQNLTKPEIASVVEKTLRRQWFQARVMV